jgi:N-acetylneuraminic acid mutarotase
MENAFVQAGDKFILLGGRGTVPAESYNYITKNWTAGANPPMQLHHFQAVEMNGLIYVVCAFTGNYPNETPVPNVYIYDPKTNVWHVGMDIPVARRRGSAGAIAYNGKIYVVSGLTNGHVSGWVPFIDEFDPTTNTWKTLPDAPHSRDHFQVAIHEGKIYCIGGRNSGYGGSTFAHTQITSGQRLNLPKVIFRHSVPVLPW